MRMNKRLVLVFLIFLVGFLLLQGNDGAVQAQLTPGGVDVSLLMETRAVVENGTFTVVIAFEPDSLVVIDAFQVYLDFDPAVLQFVLSSASNVVEPGAPFAAGRFQDVLQNEMSNTSGQVDFMGGRGLDGLGTIGPFVVGAMTFRAIAPSGSTTISFGTIDPRQTKVIVEGSFDNVVGTLNGVSFSIAANAPSTPLSDLFRALP